MRKIAPLLVLLVLYHIFIGLNHFNRLEFGDAVNDYAGYVFQISQILNDGQMPSWEPYTIGGFSFLHHSLVNDVNSPLFLSYLFVMRLIHNLGFRLDVHTIYKIYIVYICYFFIFSCGFYYLLAGLLKIKRIAFLTLLFVIFNGWSLSLLESQHNILTTIMLIPWITLFFIKIFLGEKKCPLIIYIIQGFLLGLILYSGRMMILAFYYITFLLILLVFYKVVLKIKKEKFPGKFVVAVKDIKNNLLLFVKGNASRLISLLVSFLFVTTPVFLLAPSLLRDFYPNYDGWGQATNARDIPYIKHIYLKDILQYIFPIDTQGVHRIAQSAYIGTIGFFFAIISLFFSKDKIKYLFLGLFFLLWYTCLGRESLIYSFLLNFEVYNKIRWINYLFNFAAIPLVILIGYGIKTWVSTLIGNQEELDKKMMKYSLIISFFIVILTLIMYLIIIYSGHLSFFYSRQWKLFLFQSIGLLLTMMIFTYFIYKNKINISNETKQKLLLLVTGIFIFFQLIMNYFYTSSYYFNIGYWKPYSRPPLRKEDAPSPRQTSFEPFISCLSGDYIVDDMKGYLTVNTKRLSKQNYGFLTNKLLIPYYFGLDGITDIGIKNRVLHKPIIGLVASRADIDRYYSKIISKDYAELESALEQLDLDAKYESVLNLPFSNFRRQKNRTKFGISIYELYNSGIPYYYLTNPYSDTHNYLSVLADNKPMKQAWYNEFPDTNMYQLGYEKAKKLEISVQESNKPQNITIHFWDLLKDINIEEFRNNYLRFLVNVKSKNLLFYEIFNDGKWKAYIDENPVKIETLVGGFMGISLPRGIHRVYLYHNADFIKYYLILLSVVTYFLIIIIWKEVLASQ